MLKHHFKVAIRNFWKHKAFSMLNITSLALGMAAALLLGLWIENQMSVDQFHEKKEALYRIYTNRTNGREISTDPTIPAPLAVLLQSAFPGIRQTSRMAEKTKTVHFENKVLQTTVGFTDPSFLGMFSFPLVSGSTAAFNGNNTIFISEKLANALFGREPALGKTIGMDGTTGFIVKGILKDKPGNTQFQFDCLLPWDAMGTDNSSWKNNLQVYVETQPGTDILSLEKAINSLLASNDALIHEKQTAFLYPLSRIWLYGDFRNGKPSGGVIDLIRLLGIIAAIIVIIACINFMNLSTARSLRRAKEVGIRKLIGGRRRSLIAQFIGEAIVLAFIAGGLALIIVGLVLPSFNLMTERQLLLPLGSVYYWIVFCLFCLIVGLIAGSYPALYLSSFKPVKALKGIFEKQHSLAGPRKLLFVFQFIIAIVSINLTILVHRQMNHLKTRHSGFAEESLLFQAITPALASHLTALENEIKQIKSVSHITVTSSPITRGGMQTDEIAWEGMDMSDKTDFDIRVAAGGFIQTNGLKLLEGRDIDLHQFPADSNSCIINETAARLIGDNDPVGKTIKYRNNRLTIVGLVKDYLTASPLQAISPAIIRGGDEGGFICMRITDAASVSASAQAISSVLKKYNTNYVTQLQYGDTDYDKKNRGLRLTGKLTGLFSFIAIFIACLGLLGLVMYIIETKTKEISIRRVFGAGILQVTGLVSRKFVILVSLSAAIASPIAWLLMSAFLRPIYYRTTISIFILVEAAVIALFVTIATISSQTFQIGWVNPAKTLQRE